MSTSYMENVDPIPETLNPKPLHVTLLGWMRSVAFEPQVHVLGTCSLFLYYVYVGVIRGLRHMSSVLFGDTMVPNIEEDYFLLLGYSILYKEYDLIG